MNESETEQTSDKTESQSEWVKTPVANLIRYKASGIYFARVRVRGKLFRQSLHTTVMSVAKLRLRDFISGKQEDMGDAVMTGKMTVGNCVTILRERLDGQQDIKEGAKVYRRKCIEALLKSWPALESMPVGKVGKEDCLDWAKRFADYSPSVFNNTIGTLRMILEVAVEKGARAQNPARFLTKKRVVLRKLTLPSPRQFDEFVTAIQDAGAWCSQECADLVRFMAFGGFRKTEAANITWEDVDFDKGQINVRVTKNGEARYVPMIGDMRQLLERLLSERSEQAGTEPVMKIRECQKAMDRAARVVGMKRITHHDLRHLFATRCIESGVDIPTVSRWLGHKDGGALAMKVYGHLRDQHSTGMAKRVSFSSQRPAENVIQIPRSSPSQESID